MYVCNIATEECSINGVSNSKSFNKLFDTLLSARRYLDKKVKKFQKEYDDTKVIKNEANFVRLRAQIGGIEIGNIYFIFFEGEIKEI